jgi:hypothetical protein
LEEIERMEQMQRWEMIERSKEAKRKKGNFGMAQNTTKKKTRIRE